MDAAANRASSRYVRVWLGRRNARYLLHRIARVVRRHGITRTRAKRRIRAVVDTLAALGCQPTFATPGRVVLGDPGFFQELQSLGTELALHGFDHVDFRDLSTTQAKAQLDRAAAAYTSSGIEFRGFRCPYLSYCDDLLGLLPDGVGYSSNKPIWWNGHSSSGRHSESTVFATMEHFYSAVSAEVEVSVPSTQGDVVELPTSLPDDLLLHDGLRLGPDGAQQAWLQILHETHRRGELFTLLFHPESFSLLGAPIEAVLTEAQSLEPGVWIAQLRDVESWWREKAAFSVDVHDRAMHFRCSDRATILVRSLDAVEATRPWHDAYALLESRTLTLDGSVRPLLGIAPGTPQHAVDFLAEQGYLLDASERAAECGVIVDADVVEQAGTVAGLVRHVEATAEPLVRYWRWPNAMRSALCVTGDLDALSLVDYAVRFFRLVAFRDEGGDQAA
jgi:peptidoglycan/xylan/chitin deacetylase (PgdA/CDA1 family)